MEGWAKIKPASRYAGVSERTLRTWLKKGLRHSRVGGVVLIRLSNIDDFLESFGETGDRISTLADEVLRKMK